MEKKIPVLATLVAALELCREHLSYALKIITPWFLILTIAPHLLVGLSDELPIAAGSENFQPLELILTIMYVVGWGSIAVLWHWRVLRDDSQSGKALLIDQRVWFYVLRGLLISIIVGGLALLLMIPFILLLSNLSEALADSILFFAMIACVLFFVGLVAARLSVALPAIALDVPDFGLRNAWNATANNSFGLFFVTALPLIPLCLLSWGLEASGLTEPNLYGISPPLILVHIVYQVLDFVFGLLGLTVLSLTYAFFVESKDAHHVQQT